MQWWYRLGEQCISDPFFVLDICGSTFWEQPRSSILYVLSKVPAISEVVIAFYKLYPVSFAQAQLVRASGFKVIYDSFSLANNLSTDFPPIAQDQRILTVQQQGDWVVLRLDRGQLTDDEQHLSRQSFLLRSS